MTNESITPSRPCLAIALCTRNRPDELLRACQSIAESCIEGSVRTAAALIVDAGPLSERSRAEPLAALAMAADAVEHIDVSGRARSLYESRIIALRRARELGATHVAFFDDDVELLPDYMARLSELLTRSRPAMASGVDVLMRMPSWPTRAWRRLIGVASGDPATLSASGFSGSMVLWPGQTEPFRSEYASGCNMTIEVSVLDLLSPEAERRFETYSLGEDLYFSACAGDVLIDPGLRVRHHLSPLGREGRSEYGRQLVENTAWLARLGNRSRLRWAWSMFGLAARALLDDLRLGQPRGAVYGMLRGASEAARMLARR